MENNRTKEKYTFLLSIGFVGIGGYKLYQKFYLHEDLPTYQWLLAAGLVAYGIYQLVTFFLKKKSS